MHNLILYVLMIFPFSSPNPKEKMLIDLEEIASCSDFWVKVHVVEYFIELGYLEKATCLTETKIKPFAELPQKRIGYWRLQYKLTKDSFEQNYWIQKIINAYTDLNGSDRVHAAETLAKLHYPLCTLARDDLKNQDLEDTENMLYSFALWGYTIKPPSIKTNVTPLLNELTATNMQRRKLAAYALGYLKHINETDWEKLVDFALAEPHSSEARSYLLATACLHAKKNNMRREKTFQRIKEELRLLADSPLKSDRIALCTVLAKHANRQDLKILDTYYQEKNIIKQVGDIAIDKTHPVNLDVKAAAIYALLTNYSP